MKLEPHAESTAACFHTMAAFHGVMGHRLRQHALQGTTPSAGLLLTACCGPPCKNQMQSHWLREGCYLAATTCCLLLPCSLLPSLSPGSEVCMQLLLRWGALGNRTPDLRLAIHLSYAKFAVITQQAIANCGHQRPATHDRPVMAQTPRPRTAIRLLTTYSCCGTETGTALGTWCMGPRLTLLTARSPAPVSWREQSPAQLTPQLNVTRHDSLHRDQVTRQSAERCPPHASQHLRPPQHYISTVVDSSQHR